MRGRSLPAAMSLKAFVLIEPVPACALALATRSSVGKRPARWRSISSVAISLLYRAIRTLRLSASARSTHASSELGDGDVGSKPGAQPLQVLRERGR